MWLAKREIRDDSRKLAAMRASSFGYGRTRKDVVWTFVIVIMILSVAKSSQVRHGRQPKSRDCALLRFSDT
jgi:hypothetical protein